MKDYVIQHCELWIINSKSKAIFRKNLNSAVNPRNQWTYMEEKSDTREMAWNVKLWWGFCTEICEYHKQWLKLPILRDSCCQASNILAATKWRTQVAHSRIYTPTISYSRKSLLIWSYSKRNNNEIVNSANKEVKWKQIFCT